MTNTTPSTMERDRFLKTLADAGFDQVVTVERPPGAALDVHTHPFEAKALIVEGELYLRTGAEERVYRVGQVFHLQAGEAHAERYGPQGVRYLVGRKAPDGG